MIRSEVSCRRFRVVLVGSVWFGEMDLKMFLGSEKSSGVGGCVGVDYRNENIRRALWR